MISIRQTSDTVSPHLKKLVRDVRPEGALGKVLGRAASNELRKFYRELNAKRPNKLGGKRSNFYSRVAEAVQQAVPGNGTLTIRVSHPHIAQRLYGGTVQARKGKYLAIPVHASGYGVYARIYPGTLAFIPARGGRGGYLVQAEEKTITRGPRKGGKRKAAKPGGAMIYVLKGAITQRADPTVLPASARMASALTRAAQLVRPGSK